MKYILTIVLLVFSLLGLAQENPNKMRIIYGAEHEELPKINDTIVEYHKTTKNIKKLKFWDNDELTIVEYKENGIRFKKSVYSTSNLKFKTVTKYHTNGNIILIASYDNGIVTGKFKKFYDNGNIKSEGMYNKMKKEGVWKYYNEQGVFLKEEFYDNGTLVENGNTP